MRNLLCSLVAGLAGVFLLPTSADACSCSPPPDPATALEAAGIVFEGTVVGVPEGPKEGDSPISGMSNVEYRFNVARSWKGSPGMELRVLTPGSGAACGRAYEKGATYIVYGTMNAEAGVHDSACSRTRLIANATEDLEVLGEGTPPRARGGARPAPTDGGATDSGEPAAPPADGEGDASANSETTGDEGAAPASPEGPAPAEQVDGDAATETSSPAAPADAPPEEDDDLKRGSKDCSVSSTDVGNTFGLVLLTGVVLAFRRRIGV